MITKSKKYNPKYRHKPSFIGIYVDCDEGGWWHNYEQIEEMQNQI